MSSPQIMDLVRLACGQEAQDGSFTDVVGKSLRTESSEAIGEYEFRLLCGCALGLRLLTPAPSPGTITASLALPIAAFLQLVAEPPQLVEVAGTAKDALSVSRRAARQLNIDLTPRRKPGEGAVTDFPTAEAALTATYAEVARLSRDVKAIAEAASVNAQVQDEQADILWWLFNGRSHTLSAAIAALDDETAAVSCALDLARLTKFLPGPVAAPAFIQHALGKRYASNVKKPPQPVNALLDALPPIPATVDLYTPAIDWMKGVRSLDSTLGELALELYGELLLCRSFGA
jgi:hypothetical protein